MSALRRVRARLRIAFRRRRRPFGTGGVRGGRFVRDGRVELGERTGFALRQGGFAARRAGAGIGRAAERAAPVAKVAISLPLVIAAEAIAFLSRAGAWLTRWAKALAAELRTERVLAALAVFACVALAGSQFVHYSALEVGAQNYGGQIGRVAPTPIADPEDAGSAHAYALIPVAVIALALVALTLRGRWRFGRLVALCGAIGIAVTLLIDLPSGLDGGRAGIAYADSDARLTEGFYAQLSASAVLLLSGALLGGAVRRVRPATRPNRRGRRARRRERPARRGRIAPAAALPGGSRWGRA